MIIIVVMLSGCIVTDFIDRAVSIIEGPKEFQWNKITFEERFGWADFINEDLAKTGEHLILVRNGTKFLNIYVNVLWSNPVDDRFTLLNQGNFNMTIFLPEGETVNRTYSTLGKPKAYDEYFNFKTSGEEEEWRIIVLVSGYGRYQIVAQTYEPL